MLCFMRCRKSAPITQRLLRDNRLDALFVRSRPDAVAPAQAVTAAHNAKATVSDFLLNRLQNQLSQDVSISQEERDPRDPLLMAEPAPTRVLGEVVALPNESGAPKVAAIT